MLCRLWGPTPSAEILTHTDYSYPITTISAWGNYWRCPERLTALDELTQTITWLILNNCWIWCLVILLVYLSFLTRMPTPDDAECSKIWVAHLFDVFSRNYFLKKHIKIMILFLDQPAKFPKPHNLTREKRKYFLNTGNQTEWNLN